MRKEGMDLGLMVSTKSATFETISTPWSYNSGYFVLSLSLKFGSPYTIRATMSFLSAPRNIYKRRPSWPVS